MIAKSTILVESSDVLVFKRKAEWLHSGISGRMLRVMDEAAT